MRCLQLRPLLLHVMDTRPIRFEFQCEEGADELKFIHNIPIGLVNPEHCYCMLRIKYKNRYGSTVVLNLILLSRRACPDSKDGVPHRDVSNKKNPTKEIHVFFMLPRDGLSLHNPVNVRRSNKTELFRLVSIHLAFHATLDSPRIPMAEDERHLGAGNDIDCIARAQGPWAQC